MEVINRIAIGIAAFAAVIVVIVSTSDMMHFRGSIWDPNSYHLGGK